MDGVKISLFLLLNAEITGRLLFRFLKPMFVSSYFLSISDFLSALIINWLPVCDMLSLVLKETPNALELMDVDSYKELDKHLLFCDAAHVERCCAQRSQR